MRRRVLASLGGKPLPYLRRVAYLEGHGNEYISTGWVLPASAVTLKIGAAKMDDTEGNKALCGCEDISSARWTFVLYPQGDGSRFYPLMRGWNNRAGGSSISFPRGEYREITWVSDGYERIYESKTDTSIIQETNLDGGISSFNLFANTIEQKSKSRIYFCQIYEGDVIVRDFIPVLDLDGRPAMYDEVSGQFFYNQGTGEFTWGELET